MSHPQTRLTISRLASYSASWLGCALLLWAGGCNFDGGQDDSDSSCPLGARGCPCTSGSGCDATLTCVDSVCVRVDSGTGGGSGDAGSSSSGAVGQSGGSGGSSAGASGQSGTGGDAGGASGGSGGEDGATGGSSGQSAGGAGGSGLTDPCAENGGELLASGFCFKSCTWHREAAGGDLFKDCEALRWECSSLGDYCRPPAWNDECASDADCQPGGKCTTERFIDGTVASRVCRIDCSTNSNCGTLGCMQECASGLVSPAGVCDYTGTICCAEYPNPCGG
jgi:hypothetical protein